MWLAFTPNINIAKAIEYGECALLPTKAPLAKYVRYTQLKQVNRSLEYSHMCTHAFIDISRAYRVYGFPEDDTLAQAAAFVVHVDITQAVVWLNN